MTQIKIITAKLLPELETNVNTFLKENDATIAEVKDIKFELVRTPPPAQGIPGSATCIAFITYEPKQ